MSHRSNKKKKKDQDGVSAHQHHAKSVTIQPPQIDKTVTFLRFIAVYVSTSDAHHQQHIGSRWEEAEKEGERQRDREREHG